MKKEKPTIKEVIRKCPGKTHSWVRAEVKGKTIVIRKENRNIPDKN